MDDKPDCPDDQEHLVDRWTRWMDDELFQQVHGLIQLQMIWDGYNDMLDDLPQAAREPGLFHNWVRHNYVTAAAVSIRRILDHDTRAVSLHRLLAEICEHPEEIDGATWLARWDPLDAKLGERRWGKLSTEDGLHVNPEIPCRDLEAIMERTKILREYVNKHVAHLDANRSEFETEVTFGEVSEIVGVIHELYSKYLEIVKGRALASLTLPEWRAIFETAWIPSAQADQVE